VMPSHIFWQLVRHEWRWVGNRSKAARRRIPKKWWICYIITMAIAAFAVIFYASMKDDFGLTNIWFFSLGLPYIIFFSGYGHVKREWDNNTNGWWLTLPYPRFQLVAAKFLGALLQAIAILVAVFILALLYASTIAVFQAGFSARDVLEFIKAGVGWYELLLGLSPFIISLGLFTGTVKYTMLRPIFPILWFVIMVLGSFFYWGFNAISSKKGLYAVLSGQIHAVWFPYGASSIAIILVGWLIGFGILRYTAYLLEKKLSL